MNKLENLRRFFIKNNLTKEAGDLQNLYSSSEEGEYEKLFHIIVNKLTQRLNIKEYNIKGSADKNSFNISFSRNTRFFFDEEIEVPCKQLVAIKFEKSSRDSDKLAEYSVDSKIVCHGTIMGDFDFSYNFSGSMEERSLSRDRNAYTIIDVIKDSFSDHEDQVYNHLYGDEESG